MKKIIMLLILFLSLNCFSQSAKLIGDTLFYGDHKFAVNDSVHLWYGSGQNKAFAFVFIGSGLTGVTPAPAGWSKSYMKIDKVYKTGGKYFVRGKILDNGPMLGNKLFIDIEGAIDNKEIKVE